MSRTASILTTLGKVGEAAEDAVLALLLLGMVLLSAAQILLRNFFEIGFFWSDELLRLTVMWIALAGSIAATRSRKQININLLQSLPPSRWRDAVNALVQAFAAFICIVITLSSIDFVAMSREFEDQILGGLPAWWFQSALPLAFGLMAYRYLLHTITDAMAVFRRQTRTDGT